MWPRTLLGVGPDVDTRLMAILTVGLVFVLVVLAVMVARFVRERRAFLAVECPDDPGRARALVLVHRAADGPAWDTVIDCSRWHDGRPGNCRQGCVSGTS
jgi:hypothetical protein